MRRCSVLLASSILALAAFAAGFTGACADGGETQPTPGMTATPSPTAEVTLATLGGAATPPAGTEDDLRADLAQRLSLSPADITVVSFEAVSWPNTCLGVPSPGKACAQVITPGWRAVLRAPDGTEYRYHGTAGRFVPAP